MELVVREISKPDIQSIANYWSNAENDYLTGMGVDLAKMPSEDALKHMLENQIELPYDQKAALAIVACIDSKTIGHCNVNRIEFGNQAHMHLHIWHPDYRKQGFGKKMVEQALAIFFDRLNLETVWCEPYAHNPAPEKTLINVGFEFVKRYTTIPGSINFEQEVNQYKLSKTAFFKNKSN